MLDMLKLRRLVVRLLQKHRFHIFDSDSGLTIEDIVTMDPKVRHNTFEEYVSGISKADYAGEIETKLLADALDINVSVYKAEKQGYRRIASYQCKQGRPEIYLEWTYDRAEEKNYYRLLKTRAF